MAVLAEKSQWPAEVHRLAVTDPLEGGVGGISNRQALQLADRTLFLLDTVDALERLATTLLTDVDTVATRPAEVPAPGKLRVAVRELARLQVAWEAVAGAQRYDIRTRRVGDAWGAPASAGLATAMWVAPLVQGTSYSFQARITSWRWVTWWIRLGDSPRAGIPTGPWLRLRATRRTIGARTGLESPGQARSLRSSLTTWIPRTLGMDRDWVHR